MTLSSGITRSSINFDANGNWHQHTENGLQSTLEWDAQDRLISIDKGTHRTEFSYDGFGRRVKIVEKDSGTVTSENRFIWCGAQICVRREGPDFPLSVGAHLHEKWYYPFGYYDANTVRGTDTFETVFDYYYFTRDHLGSIREMCNNANVVACYSYDPYGRRTRVSGSEDADFGFTDHCYHALVA